MTQQFMPAFGITTTQSAQWRTLPLKTTGTAAGLTDTGVRRQTWKGFGGCFNEIGWNALKEVDSALRDEALNALFGTDGCNFFKSRVPIGASDYALEWHSLNENPGDHGMEKFSISRDKKYLLPYIKAAQKVQPKLELFASAWSPPTWMKFPRAHNYGRLIWTEENLKSYALYLYKFVEAYRAEGVNVNQVHVQNEPLGDQKFPSCLWSGDQIKEFVQHYLGPLFQEKQLDCGIFLGTLNTADYDNYVFRTLIDQDARRYIAGVGFQWEGKLAIQKAAESWPGLEMLQTENECGDGENSWEYAKYIFELVRHYIRNGVVGYCYWNMILQPSGRSTWGWTQNAMITADPEANSITYNPEFHVMKHYAAYIKPGAVQLELAGPWAGLSLAFENTDGSIAVVVNNPVETELEFDCGILGRCVAATLPAMSFNTIVL